MLPRRPPTIVWSSSSWVSLNSWLPYSQFCDASANRPDSNDLDAVDLRLQCGDGVLPLAAMLAALRNAIPLSIELRSETLREGFPDASERSVAVAQSTRARLAQSLPTG